MLTQLVVSRAARSLSGPIEGTSPTNSHKDYWTFATMMPIMRCPGIQPRSETFSTLNPDFYWRLKALAMNFVRASPARKQDSTVRLVTLRIKLSEVRLCEQVPFESRYVETFLGVPWRRPRGRDPHSGPSDPAPLHGLRIAFSQLPRVSTTDMVGQGQTRRAKFTLAVVAVGRPCHWYTFIWDQIDSKNDYK